MSMAPNNPFETNQGPNQPTGQPPQKKSNPWLWVLGIIGGLGVLGMLVCCGGGYFMYKQGTAMLGDQIKGELVGNPVIEEHIGEISSVSMNFSAVIEEAQKKQEANDNTPPAIVFDIEGSKGSGQIHMSQDQAENPAGSVTLVMSDGTRHEIELGPGFGDLEEIDIDMGDIDVGEVVDEPVSVE